MCTKVTLAGIGEAGRAVIDGLLKRPLKELVDLSCVIIERDASLFLDQFIVSGSTKEWEIGKRTSADLVVVVADQDHVQDAVSVAQIVESFDVGMCLFILCGSTIPQGVDDYFDGVIKIEMPDVEATVDQIYKLLDTLLAPSQVNLDLADLKTVLQYGRRARVLYSELCDSDLSLSQDVSPHTLFRHDAAALIHITGGEQMSVMTIKKVCDAITRGASEGLVILGIRIEKGCSRIKILSILSDPEGTDFHTLDGAYHALVT